MSEVLIVIALVFGFTNCGKEGDSSKVRVQFAQSEGSLGLMGSVDTFVTPDVLRIRPLAVRISTDNSGGYMIWANNSCPGEKGQVEQDGKEFEYYSEHVCAQSEDNDWLELTAGTDAVNAELNSQSFPVPPGDYRWVSIIMCGYGTKDDGSQGYIEDVATMAYQAGYMEEVSTQYHCSPIGNYTEMDAVTIPEGGEIVINVNYDLDSMITQGIHTRDDGASMEWNTEWDDERYCKYVKDESTNTMKASYCPSVNQNSITATIQ